MAWHDRWGRRSQRGESDRFTPLSQPGQAESAKASLLAIVREGGAGVFEGKKREHSIEAGRGFLINNHSPGSKILESRFIVAKRKSAATIGRT